MMIIQLILRKMVKNLLKKDENCIKFVIIKLEILKDLILFGVIKFYGNVK